MRKKKKGNKHYISGRAFEYSVLYYFLFHGFDNIRSYASKGTLDLRAIPPRWAKDKQALGIQCKVTKSGGYLSPKERKKLKNHADKYAYHVVEIFKTDRKVYVKIKPWELKDYVLMSPQEFLWIVYGINGDSWQDYRRNWRRGIKRNTRLLNNRES